MKASFITATVATCWVCRVFKIILNYIKNLDVGVVGKISKFESEMEQSLKMLSTVREQQKHGVYLNICNLQSTLYHNIAS